MTTTITPVSQYDAATLTRAADGEDAYMDGGSAPLGTVLQKLADRAIFARDAVIATLGWNGDFSVDAGGTNSTFAVNIGTIGAVVTGTSASVYKVLSGGGSAIGASKILGGGNLANSTWYYVYAWDNAGTLDFEISTTAPSGSRRTKSGDATRRYLGCFPTTSAGAPIPLRASRNRYVYRMSALAVADTRVLNAGTSATYAAVACSTLVPPHARLASLRAELISTTASAANFGNVQTYGDAGADAFNLYVVAASGATAYRDFEIETDSSQRVQYLVSAFTSAPTLSLYVSGFRE